MDQEPITLIIALFLALIQVKTVIIIGSVDPTDRWPRRFWRRRETRHIPLRQTCTRQRGCQATSVQVRTGRIRARRRPSDHATYRAEPLRPVPFRREVSSASSCILTNSTTLLRQLKTRLLNSANSNLISTRFLGVLDISCLFEMLGCARSRREYVTIHRFVVQPMHIDVESARHCPRIVNHTHIQFLRLLYIKRLGMSCIQTHSQSCDDISNVPRVCNK